MYSNFNTGVFGDGTFFVWQGRVADDSTWRENMLDGAHADSEHNGWGQRVKVRIFGRDPSDKNDLPDEVLKMAKISNSPNSGSGAGGNKQSHQISQGDLVWGFYEDGLDQQIPVIVGVYGHSSQTQLFPGDPIEGFDARSFYKGNSGDKTVARFNLVAGGNQPREQNDDPNQTSAATTDKAVDDATKTAIKSPCEDDQSDIKAIQLVLQNLLTVTQFAKLSTTKVASNQGYSIAAAPDYIANETKKSAAVIAGFLKDIIAKGRGAVVSEVNKTLELGVASLFPNQRDAAKKAIETTTDTLTCVFNKIIAGLFDLVEFLLKDLVNKYVIGPICAVEDFLSKVIDNIIGEISDAVDSALSTINSLFGDALGQAGQILDTVTAVFGAVGAILEFFTCDTAKKCPAYDGWSFGSGLIKMPDISGDLAKSLKDKVGKPAKGGECNTSGFPCGPPSIAFNGGGGTGASGNAVVSALSGAIMAIDIIDPGKGYTSAPKVSISDGCGSGAGAVAKASIGPLDILFDGTSNGSSLALGPAGYTAPQGVTSVEMVDVGFNYLTSPNGSVGGGGVTIASPGDAIYTDPDGDTEYYSSGDTIDVTEGGGLGLTEGSEGQVYDDGGNLVQQIIGQGLLNPVEVSFDTTSYDAYEYTGISTSGTPPNLDSDWILLSDFETADIPTWDVLTTYINGSVVKYAAPQSGTFTIPGAPDPDTLTVVGSGSDLTSGDKYPVLLTLQQIVVVNPGFGYNDGDQMYITPSNGAQVVPKFDKFGKVTTVDILDPGVGFEDIPDIGIISNTGYNATFRPIFNVRRLTQEDLEKLEPGTKIVSVVDCVGKF